MILTGINSFSFGNSKTPKQKEKTKKDITVCASVVTGSTLAGLAGGAIVNHFSKADLLKKSDQSIQETRDLFATSLKLLRGEIAKCIKQSNDIISSTEQIKKNVEENINLVKNILTTAGKNITDKERNNYIAKIKEYETRLAECDTDIANCHTDIENNRNVLRSMKKEIHDNIESAIKGEKEIIKIERQGKLVMGSIIGLGVGVTAAIAYLLINHAKKTSQKNN